MGSQNLFMDRTRVISDSLRSEKTENSPHQEAARWWPGPLPPFALGNFYFLALPIALRHFIMFSKKTSANSLAATSSASAFGDLHFMGGSLKPHFLLFSDSPQPSSKQLLCLLNTFSSWPCCRKCTARRQGQSPCASFLLIRHNQFSSQSPESLLWWNPLINQRKGVKGGRNLHRNPYWCSRVHLFRCPLLLSFPQGQFLYNILGLPPLSSPKAKQTETHLVVVSTSPDRPELDLPPVKTLRDEDRKLAPVSSRELQSHRSQAQHQRSRQNIKQEPGFRGPEAAGNSTLQSPDTRQELSKSQHTTALLSGSHPSPGSPGRQGASLPCDVLWAPPRLRWGLVSSLRPK